MLTVSCRLTCAWCYRVSLCSRQTVAQLPPYPPPRHYMCTDVSEQPAASLFKNIALTMETAGFKCRCASTRLDGVTSLVFVMRFPILVLPCRVELSEAPCYHSTTVCPQRSSAVTELRFVLVQCKYGAAV
jgi:hypothetical protein